MRELVAELLRTLALLVVLGLILTYSVIANGWTFTLVSLAVFVPLSVAYGWWSWRRRHKAGR